MSAPATAVSNLRSLKDVLPQGGPSTRLINSLEAKGFTHLEQFKGLTIRFQTMELGMGRKSIEMIQQLPGNDESPSATS